MGPDSVRSLSIWQDGMKIVRECYSLTRAWPKAEMFGLTGQVRRAAVSIPANIAEGKGRGTIAEVARFSQIALGSTYELDTLLQIASELEYSPKEQFEALRGRVATLARQISRYIQTKRI
jgi:four helix bundle protein